MISGVTNSAVLAIGLSTFGAFAPASIEKIPGILRQEARPGDVLLLMSSGAFGGLPETLLDQEKFRAYFKENVSPSQERWHSFLNNLNEANLRELMTLFEIFRDEIVFVLGSIDIPDDEPFEFLKRLSAAIRSMRDTTLGYDETKPFARFLWEVFAGWNWITGYREGDIITEMIESI